MTPLILRIEKLRKELEKYFQLDIKDNKFNLHVYVPRFIESIKRLNNNEISKLASNIDIETEEGFSKLESGLSCIFDLIDDILYEQNEQLLVTFDSKSKNKLIDFISDCLSCESANHLHTICNNLGLVEGTRDEAYQSKRSYVYSRISFYNQKQIWNLSKKLEGKCDELDKFILSIENGDHLKLEAKFENIQQRIIEEIDKAEFLIWIAVAWFTDRKIALKLHEKKEQGINIEIIVIDDEINNKVADKIYKYFNVNKVSPVGKYKNIMHHKFCIIDLKKVIHGSYNWSIRAQYNKETVSIIENKALSEKFAREFIKLKSTFKD